MVTRNMTREQYFLYLHPMLVKMQNKNDLMLSTVHQQMQNIAHEWEAVVVLGDEAANINRMSISVE